MEIITDCLSPHVMPLQAEHMQLVWREPFEAESLVRVIAWTCPHERTAYELCRAAGQAYIRRTCHGADGSAVHETYRWSVGEGGKVWNALLRGHVR